MALNAIRNSKVAQNAIWIIAGKVAQSLIGFIVNILTARYLGPTNYGLISYAASIVAFVVPIMNLGFGNILVQEQTNYPEEENKIYGTSILLSLISSLACIVGITVYTFVVDVGEKVTNIVLILYSVMLIFQAIELIQYWFQAKFLSKYMSITTLIAYILVALYKIILLTSKASVYFFALSNSLDYFFIAVFLFIIYKKLGGKHLTFSWKTAKRMFNSSKHYIVSSMMVTIFAQTDKIMIKLMLNKTEVGYYSAAVTCAGLTSFVFSAIIDSMRPSIYAYKKNNNYEAYEKNISRLYCLIIYLALIQSFAMSILSSLIIKVIYGTNYNPSISALRIIVWYTTFSYMGAVRNVWILGEGKQKYLWILNSGGALTNVILNFILIPIMGIDGAALASLITQIFTNIVMNAIVYPLSYNNYLILKGLNPKLVFELFKKR